MKILIFSDGHGHIEKITELKNTISAGKFDFALFAGDFTRFGNKKSGGPFFQEVLNLGLPVFSVLGNCDTPEILQLTRQHVMSVDNTVARHAGLVIAGSGGGSKFTGTTPYERTDEQLVGDLDPVTAELQAGKVLPNTLITVSHNPPHNTKLDAIPSAHVGSPLIRSFLQKWHPLLHVSGHIHESYAIDHLGNTVLINPGALADGRYAVCRIEKNGSGFEVTDCRLMKFC